MLERIAVTVALLVTNAMLAQMPPAERFLGTVKSVDGQSITVTSDKNDAVAVATDSRTRVQKIAPADRDLSKAQTISVSDLAAGDRILVRGSRNGETLAAESIVVMTAREISERNERERREWYARGISGLVDKVDPTNGEIAVVVRTGEESKVVVISTAGKASFKRYANDSVRFADAGDSSLAEVRKGDQLRALGEKSADGSRLRAEKIVFGTFRSVAGSITALSPTLGEMEIKEVQTGKTIVVRTKPLSQVKRMPQMSPGSMAPARMGGMPDLSMLIERLPASQLSEFKPGETIIASATAGAQSDQMTAIVVVGNAEILLTRLTSANAQASQRTGPTLGGLPGGFGLDALMGVPTVQ